MNYLPLVLILISYILGSIPFGFVITKLTKKEDILKIGWRKTSTSNVFANVGRWQGLLTGLLDIGKGFLAVYLAQYLGLPLFYQSLCGVFAVVGHNWSCFFHFAGGRGLATLFGALIVINLNTFLFSLIPLVIFTIFWTASIGTILFFISGISLSLFWEGFLVKGGALLTLSLIPMIIKRLSPFQDISKAQGRIRRNLIKNRLIFDQDFPPTPRIKKILKKI